MGVGDITLEAARSSIRGGGWVPSGPRPRSGSAELPRAARRALRRHRGRAQLMCLFFQRSISLSIALRSRARPRRALRPRCDAAAAAAVSKVTKHAPRQRPFFACKVMV
jgi:hypothetical protein